MAGTASYLASSRAVVRSGVFSLVGFLASAAYMFLVVPVALAYMGQEQYGLWMTVAAATAYIALTDFGVSTSFVTFIARAMATQDFRQASRVVHLGLLFYCAVSLVLIVIALAFSSLVFALLRIPAAEVGLARDALLLILMTFAMTSIGSVLTNALAAGQRMDVVNVASTVALAVKFVAIVMALDAGWGLRGLLLADLAVTMAMIPVMVVLTRRFMPSLSLGWQGYDHALMRSMVGFGARIQVSRLADMVAANFDKLLLARLSGLSVVATYDFGAKPAGRLRQLPATVIMPLVAAVSALDAVENQDRIRAALVRSTRYLAIVSAPLFGFCIVFAGPVITIWLGQEQAAAAMALRIFSVAFFMSAVVSALSTIAIGRGEPEYQMRTMLIQTALNIVLSTILVLWFGFVGAVCGTAVATLAGSVLFFRLYGSRLVADPLRLLASAIGPPVGCAALAGAVSWLGFAGVRHLADANGRLAVAVLLTAFGIVFAVLYALLLFRTGTVTADDAGFLKGVLPHRIASTVHRWMQQETEGPAAHG